MALSTLKELRDNVASTTRETQINSLIDTYINLSLQEVNDPAWAFEQTQAFRGYNHLWSFNRRATTLPVTDTVIRLPRDCDKISLLLYYSPLIKLQYVPDELAVDMVTDVTATGLPLYYRKWEEEGVSVTLTTDDSVTVVSSSAADTSSFTVSVVGYSTKGYIQSEVITLNGITAVAGTLTFAEDKPLKISKSGKTTGYITVNKTTAPTTELLVLAPEDRSPRFKMISVYPSVADQSGSITAFADSVTSPGVMTTVTSAAHGLADGDDVIITLSPIYNGTYDIDNVTTNTFDITKAYVAEVAATQRWDQIIYNLYMEYYTRIRQLVNDTDVPDIDEKWLWVVRLGAIAKVYAYQKADDKLVSTQAMYAAGIRSMVKSDMQESDYIPHLTRHDRQSGDVVEFTGDGYGTYGLRF